MFPLKKLSFLSDQMSYILTQTFIRTYYWDYQSTMHENKIKNVFLPLCHKKTIALDTQQKQNS